MFSAASILAILSTVWATIWGFVAPWLVQFGIWIAAAGAGVLGWLFSPSIRKWTIAVVAAFCFIAGVWINGYLHGSGSAGKPDICANPHFHQVILKGKFSTSVVSMVREHNDLGESLGCWTNSNIR